MLERMTKTCFVLSFFSTFLNNPYLLMHKKFHLFLVLLQIYPMPIAVECMNNAGGQQGSGTNINLEGRLLSACS